MRRAKPAPRRVLVEVSGVRLEMPYACGHVQQLWLSQAPTEAQRAALIAGGCMNCRSAGWLPAAEPEPGIVGTQAYTEPVGEGEARPALPAQLVLANWRDWTAEERGEEALLR